MISNTCSSSQENSNYQPDQNCALCDIRARFDISVLNNNINIKIIYVNFVCVYLLNYFTSDTFKKNYIFLCSIIERFN